MTDLVDVPRWLTPPSANQQWLPRPSETTARQREAQYQAYPALIGRRYAPFTPKSARSGMQRVERYTFTAFWSVRLGSRIRSRDPETRIEMIDLTS